MGTISYQIPEELANAIASVKHPAINFSLIELGIIRDYYLNGKTIILTFAMPFPNIPIKDKLVNSVEAQIKRLDYSLEYQIVLMTDIEKNNFLEMEHQGWKGL